MWKFFQYSNYRLGQLRNDGWDVDYDQELEWWKSIGLPEGDFADRNAVPSMDHRLTGVMAEEQWYPRYRHLSLFTHPTKRLVDTSFEVDEPRLEFRAESHLELNVLAFSAVLVAVLALELETIAAPGPPQSRTGLGVHCSLEEFSALLMRLIWFTTPEAHRAWASGTMPPWSE